MSKNGAAAEPQKKGTWETTPERGLLRNTHSGQYYYRYTLSGKQKWVWLETPVYLTAKLRALDKRAEVVKLRTAPSHVSAATATIGELMETYLASLDGDLLKRRDPLGAGRSGGSAGRRADAVFADGE